MTPAVKQLEAAGIKHRLLTYEAGPVDEGYGQAAAQALGLQPDQVYKTLIAVLDGERLCVAMVPVNRTLRLKSLALVAGARSAAMADARQAEKATGYVVGAISPLGQRRRLPTYLHEDALRHDLIYVSGGRRGLEIEIAATALTNCCEATLVAIAAPA